MTVLWMFLAALIAGGVCGFSGYLIGHHVGRDVGFDLARIDNSNDRLGATVRYWKDIGEDPYGELPPTQAPYPLYVTAPRAVDADDLTARPRLARDAVQAADMALVVYPEPGTLRPQPAPDPGPDTVTMPKLTDTGELRALTDEFIHKMKRGEVGAS